MTNLRQKQGRLQGAPSTTFAVARTTTLPPGQRPFELHLSHFFCVSYLRGVKLQRLLGVERGLAETAMPVHRSASLTVPTFMRAPLSFTSVSGVGRSRRSGTRQWLGGGAMFKVRAKEAHIYLSISMLFNRLLCLVFRPFFPAGVAESPHAEAQPPLPVVFTASSSHQLDHVQVVERHKVSVTTEDVH